MDFALLQLVLIILAVVFTVLVFLLPFFVFRIRNEIIELNQTMRRLHVLIEAVIPDSKKPKPAPKPKEVLVDGQLMRVFPKCGINNDFQNRRCSCGAVLFDY